MWKNVRWKIDKTEYQIVGALIGTIVALIYIYLISIFFSGWFGIVLGLLALILPPMFLLIAQEHYENKEGVKL